jgi:hypothetical protein
MEEVSNELTLFSPFEPNINNNTTNEELQNTTQHQYNTTITEYCYCQDCISQQQQQPQPQQIMIPQPNIPFIVKKKRNRRTKLQIEADKQAKLLQEQQQQQQYNYSTYYENGNNNSSITNNIVYQINQPLLTTTDVIDVNSEFNVDNEDPILKLDFILPKRLPSFGLPKIKLMETGSKDLRDMFKTLATKPIRFSELNNNNNNDFNEKNNNKSDLDNLKNKEILDIKDTSKNTCSISQNIDMDGSNNNINNINNDQKEQQSPIITSVPNAPVLCPQPNPTITPTNTNTLNEKRKRGRPKGSKRLIKMTYPQPPCLPFLENNSNSPSSFKRRKISEDVNVNDVVQPYIAYIKTLKSDLVGETTRAEKYKRLYYEARAKGRKVVVESEDEEDENNLESDREENDVITIKDNEKIE